MPEADVEDEVTSILTDIDLLDKADAIAEKLSGGQKRKLSVGELSQKRIRIRSVHPGLYT
jgi:ABC-type polar amino acid transport system ATPase subunit